MTATEDDCRFRPLTGISLFLSYTSYYNTIWNFVFVPSRGFLFFYGKRLLCTLWVHGFSSPHGDFSFSIKAKEEVKAQIGFRPLTGISLFLLWQWLLHRFRLSGFRPLTGISLFLFGLVKTLVRNTELFSSPHGDFSFSIGSTVWRWWLHRTVFVPSRGFLFFYRNMLHEQIRKAVFVPSRGFLFFYRNDSPRCADDGRRFSSPHGDFSFSMKNLEKCISSSRSSFRPLTGISLFLWTLKISNAVTRKTVFVPSRGFLFFYTE